MGANSSWYPYQVDFTGGEVSPRMFNRADVDVHRRSVLNMINWMPTLQGPARRAPGTRFIREVENTLDGRLLPYNNINNDRGLLVLTPLKAEFTTNLPSNRSQSGTLVQNTSGFRQEIVVNPEFTNSQGGWNFEPARYFSKDGAGLGCDYIGGAAEGRLRSICRNWKYPTIDNEECDIDQTVQVTFPTDVITISYRIIYQSNVGFDIDDPNVDPNQQYDLRVTVGTTPGAGDILDTMITGAVGTITERVQNINLPSVGWTGALYIRFFQEALTYASTPEFWFDRFSILTDAQPPDPDEEFVTPYTVDMLQDIQYVQSPYDNKEIVMVHPEVTPQWFYFDREGAPAEYTFENIPFVNPPPNWATDNYPSACTSYQGRLMLGGTPLESEQVNGTRPGLWYDFTVNTDPLVADNGIQFTSIYRSPIKWMSGHKDLLVGAEEFEYVVISDDGILKPTDIDVRLHSTHGSLGVQPVGMGSYVGFAGELGTRLRASQKNRDNAGWVAPDRTIYADHITTSGIRRMARVRNPHQMLVCLLGDGNLAILHDEPLQGVSGWSRLRVDGTVIDICAQTNKQGVDTLYMLVRRNINGVTRLYLESIEDWTDKSQWVHLQSYLRLNLVPSSSIVTGLDHLEGRRVQVVADGNFLGTFVVTDGEVDIGVDASLVNVGLAQSNRISTLPPFVPPEVGGLGSDKRFSEVVVRVIRGTRLIINGESPPDRDPLTPMNTSEPLDLLKDNSITELGYNAFAIINIEETAPYPVEVVGIFGKLQSNAI